MPTSWSSRLKRGGESWAGVRKVGVSSTARLVTQRRNRGHLSRFVQRPSDDGMESAPATRGRRGRSPRWGSPHTGEVQRDKSRSRPTPPALHRGTITTIAGGSVDYPKKTSKYEIQAVLTGANQTPLGIGKRVSPALTFDDWDLIRGVPYYDEPIVISVVAAEYKIERVLIDQGSSANILYWSTYHKMKLSPSSLTECPRALYGFRRTGAHQRNHRIGNRLRRRYQVNDEARLYSRFTRLSNN
ncbi:hypothetical protein CR513_61310, partial [Mucuna pruriens]